MKIKIPTIGSRGDVQPFIALAQGLSRAGHSVNILSHPVMSNLVESHGVMFQPVGPDIDMDEVSASIRAKASNPWKGLMEVMRFAFDTLEKSHQDILDTIKSADLVIISSSSAAGKNESELLNLPYASVNLMPWGIQYSDPNRPILKKMLYGAIDGIAKGVTTKPLNNLRKKQGLPPVGPEGMASPTLDLIPISPVVFPPISFWPKRHHMTGYWFVKNPEGWIPPIEVEKFLDQGDPPIVISFGAMGLGDHQARETAELLVAAVKKIGVRAIFIGWEKELKSMDLTESIFVCEPTPFDWLLHKTSAIVHHGGFGTTSTAFSVGIPSLVIPHLVDQFNWAQKVFELGVGPKPIPRSKLKFETFISALEELIGNEDYKEGARKLSDQIKSEDGIGNAINLIKDKFG